MADIPNGGAARAGSISPWLVLALLALGEFLGMTLWFSATAVTGALVGEFRLSAGQTAWLTMAVQGGFVAGTLVSAVLNLPDLIATRRLFALGCFCGAVVTSAITLTHGATPAIALRFATGVALALVYPTGMKIVSGWFRDRRGTALAVLVAALTVGQAFPYLLASLVGSASWRTQMLVTAGLAVVGGLIVLLFVHEGPYDAPAERFDPHAAVRVYIDRRTRFAVFGYLGHQWELYAMWTWIGTFAGASLAAHGQTEVARAASAVAFIGVGAGAIGCLMAGFAGDRLGKARVAGLALRVSGCCALLSGLVYGRHPLLLFLFVAVWGTAVVADSAQFSALVADNSRPEYVGTALTVETCSGYLLTMLTIRLVPTLAGFFGWQWVFLALVPGPVFGAWAVRRIQVGTDGLSRD
ncbi:MAG TPA: MFS transporter [Vicinamibacterales bacterium]